MGSKQSSLSDASGETSPDSQYCQYTNGSSTYSTKQTKKKNLKKQQYGASNCSTPSLRDKIDHLKMGVSFETSDSSDMPDATELERRFQKGLFYKF